MKRLLLVGAVLCVVAAACSTSGSGGGGSGGGGSDEGAGKPPCTAGIALPSTPAPARTAPTIVDDPPTDLRLETPGYGFLEGVNPVISADGSKLLVRTQGQNAVPGGFAGDTAWVLRDRTTGQNTMVMPTDRDRDLIYPDTAAFLPDGSVAFTELGWWNPLPPDQAADLWNKYLSQVFRWDANTHEYTNLSLGPDGQPIGVVPPGFASTGPMPVAPVQGPEDVKVSADGRYVFFMTRVPLGPDDPPDPRAWDPRYVRRDLFRRDTVTGEIVKIDVGNHPEIGPAENGGNRDVSFYDVSADGRDVAFATPATGGLAETGFCPSGDLVFLRDIDAGTTTLVSRDVSGAQRYGTMPQISADGRYVTYQATGHVNGAGVYFSTPGFSNLPGVETVMWDRQTDTTDWILPTAAGTPAAALATSRANAPSITPDNNLFLFTTFDDGPYAEGVVPGDGDGHLEIVLYNRAANTIRKLSLLADGTNVWSDDNSGSQVWLSPDGSRAYFPSREAMLPDDTYEGPLSNGDLYSVALH